MRREHEEHGDNKVFPRCFFEEYYKVDKTIKNVRLLYFIVLNNVCNERNERQYID